MQTKETSFFKEMIMSIKDFEKYPEMASKSFRHVCNYLLILMAIFTLIVTALSVYNVTKKLNEGIEYFKNEIPNLSFTDNKLIVESEQALKLENNLNMVDLIIIDTNNISEEQIDNYKLELEKHSTGAIFLSDKLVVNLGNGTLTYTYEKLSETYNIENMTKDDIVNYFSGSNLVMLYVGIFIMSYIYLFLTYLASTIMDALILGTVGYVTSLLMKIRIKYVAMFKIAIHALTLPIILNLLYIIVQTLFGFRIEYFEIMYIAVSYIYIVAAILMIKSDIIKRGQELAKIVEEEQKVKEQLEREKEEQRQKEEEENKNKEEKKKNKKDKDKNNDEEDDLGAEPQGGNA